ncbi:TPA: recombinase family protein, partial [Streptococcus suis]
MAYRVKAYTLREESTESGTRYFISFKKIYLVGIYCRLSKDDGTDNESASIATQKSILTDYVKKQGWHIAKTYVDDGYSGTNFQRPSFQNMIK